MLQYVLTLDSMSKVIKRVKGSMPFVFTYFIVSHVYRGSTWREGGGGRGINK